MLSGMSEVLGSLDDSKRKNIEGQIGFFDLSGETSAQSEPEIPFLEEFPENELLTMEKETTGLFLSGHPMFEYTDKAKKLKCTEISQLVADDDERTLGDSDRVRVMGIITSLKKKITKNNSEMAYVTVEDTTGAIEILVFPKIYQTYYHLLKDGKIYIFSGRLSIREDEEPKIICDTVETAESFNTVSDSTDNNCTAKPQKKKRHGLFLKFSDENDAKISIAEKYLAIFDGNTPLYYYFEKDKRYLQQPSDRGVYINEPLIRELKKLLGDENVAVQ